MHTHPNALTLTLYQTHTHILTLPNALTLYQTHTLPNAHTHSLPNAHSHTHSTTCKTYCGAQGTRLNTL